MPSSFSLRPRVAIVIALLLAAAGSGASLIGRPALSFVAVSVLLALASVVLLDMRRRQQAAGRADARVESRVRELGGQLYADNGNLRADVERLRTDVEKLHRSVGELTSLTVTAIRAADESAQALRETDARAQEANTITHDLLHRLDHEPVSEVQALLQLVPKVPGAPPLPGIGGWALSAASLLQIWHIIETRRPLSIVECGSGTSTLWLAYAAKQVEGARVVALEHDERYASATLALLDNHDLADFADVRYAPLREVPLGGVEVSWYDVEQLSDVESIDLLVVDGPPKWTGPLARFPAVPILRDRLESGALVLADDATRSEEKEAIRRWRTEYRLGPPQQVSRDLVMLSCD